jgi:hypothetical protein
MDIDPDQSQPSPDYPGQIQMPSPAPAPHTELTEPLLPSATKQEKFLLTAADQEPGGFFLRYFVFELAADLFLAFQFVNLGVGFCLE